MVILLTASLQAVAAGDPMQWLERLATADERVAYRGVLIFESGDLTESLQVTHGHIEGQPYDHLEYLDGDRREVIRSGSSLTCIHPGLRLNRLLQGAARDQGVALDSHYSLQVSGDSRIAGRPVVLLEAMPRDSFRFGYRFALDRETGLPLRYERVDDRMQVLERFQFATVEISDQLPPQWQRVDDEPGRGASTPAAAANLPAEWVPGWLPPGFDQLPVAAEAEIADVQSYSDGLASFSIFVAESERVVDDASGSARRGATVAHTTQLRFGDKSYVVTVIGEVPPVTAQRVADAVGWREPQP